MIALILLLGAVPFDVQGTQIANCDYVEFNRYHDPDGRVVFNQMIFYTWDLRNGRYDVRGWRLNPDGKSVVTRNWENLGYVIQWKDTSGVYKLTTDIVRYTYTDFDPELRERDFIPRDRRKPLFK